LLLSVFVLTQTLLHFAMGAGLHWQLPPEQEPLGQERGFDPEHVPFWQV
jgi:hypothetical protein